METPVFGHAMVNLNDNTLVVIGGGGGGGQYSTFHQFTCGNGDCKWQKMSQELSSPRLFHVAMAIPDDLLDCN